MASASKRRGSVGNGIRVELAISCRNLRDRDRFSRSDPVCVLMMKSRGQRDWKTVGRTEKIENTFDPEWTKTFVVDYYFEEKQNLRFAIYDWDTDSETVYDQDDLGTMECTLGEILAGKNKFERHLSPYRNTPGDCGIITVVAEEQSSVKDKVTFQFSASNLDKKDLFSQSDPFFTISRVLPDGCDTIVYRSEWIKDNANPDWAPVEITANKLCNGDWNRPLKIEIFDYDDDGGHDYIGSFTTSLDQLADGEGFQIVTWDVVNEKKQAKNKDYENSGQVILKSMKIEQDTTFLDFLRGGLKLHFVVAVDFTLSNGDPRDPQSLHYLDRDRTENPYTMAIRTVGEIFQDYDYDETEIFRYGGQYYYRSNRDKKFLALGFGGEVNGRVSNCFPLNGNSRDPYCFGIDGVIDAYYDSLENVPLADPTCYAPVIDYVREMAEKFEDGENYVVLLIITDGGIADMEDTQRSIIKLSELPASIVIVGVGDIRDNATKLRRMQTLDDETVERDDQGIKMTRDVVDFVELSKYIPDGRLDPITFSSVMDAANARYHLAKDVLAEVPYQVVEYMEMQGFKPGIPDVDTALDIQQRMMNL